jgi:hypothetical protein
VQYSLRYFGSSFPEQPFGSLLRARPQFIRIGAGRTRLTWHLALLPTEPLRVCAVERGTA